MSRVRIAPRGWLGALSAAVLAALPVSACVAREGTATVVGELDVEQCWSGPFDLEPNFFAAAPFRETLGLRLQRGSDFLTYADGVGITIDDVHAIRGDDTRPSRYGEALKVAPSPAVVPPGVPVVADPDPALVHFSLYLQQSCRTQNITLHAAEEVLLAADGSCTSYATRNRCADLDEQNAPRGRSTITFDHVFGGDILERNEDKRRIKGRFDVYLTDPREACDAGLGVPPCRGHLTGEFDFLYERSRPYQPFP